MPSSTHGQPWRFSNRSLRATLTAIILMAPIGTDAIHHMKIVPPRHELSARAVANTPLVVSNQCGATIYPGILTQSGTGPGTGGFELTSGSNKSMIVSADWQGRVWGRSNCTFSGSTGQCGSGDCGGLLSCTGTGQVPTTLAEFTLNAGDGHTYYDVSLVDGYNLPLAIMMLSTNSSFNTIPRNLTNPSCVGTVGDLSAPGFNPYSSSSSTFLGTNISDPLPFDSKITLEDVAQWCPWDLQVSSSTSPSGGVYIYPDGSLNRPAFDPCYSACSKYNLPQDCCTGIYDSASSCTPSSYSKAAKSVCPDAYSYAFDDQTSTFIVPSGPGFEVVFCPGGRSTNIIATSNGALVQLTQNLLYHINVPVTIGGQASQIEQTLIDPEQNAHKVHQDVSKLDSMHPISQENVKEASDTAFVGANLASSGGGAGAGAAAVVAAASAASTTLSLPEMSFISQWHGTGSWTNSSTTSTGSLTANLGTAPRAFSVPLVVMGFMLWNAW